MTCDFVLKFFLLRHCLDASPTPNIISDSDPASAYGLFRIRIYSTGSDPLPLVYQYA
jgi:hypothetical protein